jgi:type IV pilus assembly protein PilC
MAIFKYKILDPEGKVKEGQMEAKDKFALYHSIKQDGSTVVSADEVGTEKSLSFSSNINLPFFSKVKAHDKITFAKNLSKMIDAGLPVTRGLSIIERQSKGKFKTILGELGESISKGNTFSDSMKNYPEVFSTLFGKASIEVCHDSVRAVDPELAKRIFA